MVGVIYLLAFVCLFIGLLYPTLALFGYDVYTKKSKTLTVMIRWRNRGRDIWQISYMNNLLKIVAPLIPLSADAERRLNDELVRADIPYTPQEYYAKAFLSAFLGILIAVLAMSMNSPILIIAGLLLAVYLFLKNIEQVKDTLKNKYALIEHEIPMFIRSVESSLHSDRDIIHAVERFNRIASPAMKSELEILLADMRSSNIPKALARFDARLNSPEISRLVAALTEMDRGIDQTLTLQYLAKDMTVMHRQQIQRELDKRPGKMKRAILPAGVILVIMMFYILIQAVIQSASTLI